MITECSKTPTRILSNLKNEKKKNAGIKPIKIEVYISKIIPCKGLQDNHSSNGESDDSDDSDGNGTGYGNGTSDEE